MPNKYLQDGYLGYEKLAKPRREMKAFKVEISVLVNHKHTRNWRWRSDYVVKYESSMGSSVDKEVHRANTSHTYKVHQLKRGNWGSIYKLSENKEWYVCLIFFLKILRDI